LSFFDILLDRCNEFQNRVRNLKDRAMRWTLMAAVAGGCALAAAADTPAPKSLTHDSGAFVITDTKDWNVEIQPGGAVLTRGGARCEAFGVATPVTAKMPTARLDQQVRRFDLLRWRSLGASIKLGDSGVRFGGPSSNKTIALDKRVAKMAEWDDVGGDRLGRGLYFVNPGMATTVLCYAPKAEADAGAAIDGLLTSFRHGVGAPAKKVG
jgi:hypothetical protein